MITVRPERHRWEILKPGRVFLGKVWPLGLLVGGVIGLWCVVKSIKENRAK